MSDLEKDNMDDYARSLGTQEGFLPGPTVAEMSSRKVKPTSPTNPDHYQNTDKKYEHRFVAKAWNLEYYLSAATKYIARAGRKTSEGMSDSAKEIQDLEKAMVYVQFRIDELKEK